VTGGSVTGGSATGGSATGGSATGGAATGGAATGGAAAADGAAAPASGRSTTGVSLPSASASREPAAAGGEVEVVVAASDAAGSCSGARFSCAANCSSRVRGAGCRFLRAAARLAGAFRAGGMVSANGMKRIDHNEGSKSRTLHAPCLPTTSTTRCVRCSLKAGPRCSAAIGHASRGSRSFPLEVLLVSTIRGELPEGLRGGCAGGAHWQSDQQAGTRFNAGQSRDTVGLSARRSPEYDCSFYFRYERYAF